MKKIRLNLFQTLLILCVLSLGAPGWGVERVSVDSSGVEGDGYSSRQAISGDGRYVVFYSEATNLVPGDTNGRSNNFLHDRQTGETKLVLVPLNGDEANGWAGNPDISADGRFVTASSSSSNLLPADINVYDDVYLQDLQSGEITLVSVDSNGVVGNENSSRAAISGDGRYVVFNSDATNLVPGDTNGSQDIFVHDCLTGDTSRVSIATGGAQANDYCGRPEISDDGRFVAFYSRATNLVPGDTNGVPDLFVHDRQTGETTRVSVATDGTEANEASDDPKLSADGRYVVFHSEADNLVSGDTNDTDDVFIRDRLAGTTERISVNAAGDEANGQSHEPDISADGRYVAFHSNANNLISGDYADEADVFVRDTLTGETMRASVSRTGEEGNGSCYDPVLSSNGRFVVFESRASNLVTGDNNDSRDVFVRDLLESPQVPVIIDVQANGSDGPLSLYQGISLEVVISLVPGDQAGQPADWWVVAESPMGFYWYTLNGEWVLSATPLLTYDGSLVELSPRSILNMSNLPVGDYKFYFAVDDNQDGKLDADHMDQVEVTILPPKS